MEYSICYRKNEKQETRIMINSTLDKRLDIEIA